MADLIGTDFTPPDVRAKVTGAARYAEDFRRDGMLFCRLLKSPMPHAVVRSIDLRGALAMDGVVDVLTADDVPAQQAPRNNILTNEPHFVGEPILAVAAVDEQTAEDAIEAIVLDLEPRDFCVDPLDALRSGGPSARTAGNVLMEGDVTEHRWSDADFTSEEPGQMPTGSPTVEWSFGDVDAGFEEAELILDESFVVASHAHHSMEPRSCFSSWENGTCYVHGSAQSQAFVVPGLASYIDIEPEDLVFVAEFCGGGFGSKGSAYPEMSIAAHMARKAGRPVLLRVSRAEEYYLGRARCGFQGRIRLGFRGDGKVTSCDLYIVQDNGPNSGFGDLHSAADAVTLVYTPPAMRFRGVQVLTNTPPRAAQRGPGQNQIACAVEPLLDKAAAQLGVDRVAIRRLNAPDSDSAYGDSRGAITSAHLREALDMGAERFGWAERRARSGERDGSKVRGVGVGQAYHSAGSSGFDGLVRITPDGILHIHSGVGNLGTYSYAATARAAAHALGYSWENCVIHRGDSRENVPWNLGQFGSNTSFTMTRSNWAAAMDAVRKLRQIASLRLGGRAEDYDVRDEMVVHRTSPGARMSCARAARWAVEMGGPYSGQNLPGDINDMTRRSAEAVAGTGLVGVARDDRVDATVPALAAGFVEVEVDTETGRVEILDYLGVADCGTILHPQGLAAQVRGGAVMGFGMALTERHVYDARWGLPAAVGLHRAKPPSYLDVPAKMDWAATDIADPENPVGAKGVGEPLMGCAAAAVLCAISDALGGHYFNRNPVVADMILDAAARRERTARTLATNTQ